MSDNKPPLKPQTLPPKLNSGSDDPDGPPEANPPSKCLPSNALPPTPATFQTRLCPDDPLISGRAVRLEE